MTKFPSRLVHGTGGQLTIDESRLLLEFRDAVSEEDLAAPLEAASLALEGDDDGGDARRMERVNHTTIRYWVRSARGDPIDDERIAMLYELFGDRLSWIGPVYWLGGRQHRRELVAPLPNVLLVRESSTRAPNARRAIAAAGGRGFKVTEDRERSRYLAGWQYFVIDDPRELDAYRLRDRLVEQSDAQVADVRFETMPLIVPTAVIPNDALFGQQWDMTQIDAPEGWDISTGTVGVVVAVLDEGVDLTHPDLTLADTGINLGTMSGDGSPTGSHGTACAGIVAATFDNSIGVAGVAGSVGILPIAFVNWTDAEVAAGIGYATANGANVVSMSFGFNGWDPMIIDPSITAADAAGLVLAAATHNHDSAVITYPATNPLVIAVGATDQTDERKSPTSPDGETWGSNFGPEIDVAAPGVLVPTTDIQGAGGYNVDGSGGSWAGVVYPSFGPASGDYVTVFDGTSAATPHVAGLAALLLSEYPTLTNTDVRRIIERSTEKTGGTPYADTAGHESGSWNDQLGYGRINVHRALDMADVMIRDWPSDTGLEPAAPTGGNFWNFSDIVVRIFDDDLFVPSDPLQSQYLELGQTNYLYVRVRNTGPRAARNVSVGARLTPFVGTQFVYPHDWTAIDGTHLAATPVSASFASIPAGGEEIAKFSISAHQVSILHSNSWHPCLVASVTADNDYAFQTAAFTANPVVTRINNLAQRNLSVINVLADTASAVAFPFLAGNALNTDRHLDLVVNRSALPRRVPLLLALDRDNVWFPHVDVDAHVRPGGDDDCGGGLEFLDSSRVRTRFGCCDGVLTLAAGSRFDCVHRQRVRDVQITGGDIVLRNGQRFAHIVDDIAVVRIEKAAGQLLPLSLEAAVPSGFPAGQAWELAVAQRDESQHVVGGASALLMTT